MSTTDEIIQRLRTIGGEPRNGGITATGRRNGGNGNADLGESPESSPSTGSRRKSGTVSPTGPDSKRAHNDASLQKNGDASARGDGDASLHQTSATSKKGAEVKLSNYLTDLHHADNIVELHGRDIRYCRKLGGFFVWNEGRWVVDETGYVWRCAIHAAWQVYKGGVSSLASVSGHPQVKEWALKTLSRRHIEDALKQLQSRPQIVTTAGAFDRDRWLFNVKNGTIDLRTGEMREHLREDLITRIAPVEFNAGGERPRLWPKFLSEIFGGNRELMDFVQRACGYALTGSVSEQKLFFLHGSGANGKTTFLETLMFVMGDYARRIAPSLLFAQSRDMHPTGLADLKGSRLAVTTEVEFGKRLAEAVVKELTGGDRLAARRMRQDSFEFEPTHKVFMCGNHLPVIRGSDHAIWRRIVLIPFGVTIPEERQDKDLTAKLRAEAAGILNWLVTGCLEWQKKGLGEPGEIIAATRSYRADMDALGIFLSDRCVLTPNAQTMSADLYKAYGEWCEKNSEYPMTMCSLSLGLKEHGFKQKRTSLGRAWQGICLKGKRS